MAIQMLLPGLGPAPMLSANRTGAGLSTYPHVDSLVLQKQAKEIGRAGELLARSVLTRLGEQCYAAGEEAAFDLLLMRPEAALRVQVKTTSTTRDGVYRFRMQKGYRGAPAGVRLYAPGDYDLAALVILPHDAVLFTAEKREVHMVPCQRVEALRARPYASLHQALRDLGLAAPGGEAAIARH